MAQIPYNASIRHTALRKGIRMKMALISEEQIKDILYALESCQETGWTTAYDENAVDDALAIVKSLKVSDPAILLHVKATDTYPKIDFQVMDGEGLQPGMVPIPVYAGDNHDRP